MVNGSQRTTLLTVLRIVSNQNLESNSQSVSHAYAKLYQIYLRAKIIPISIPKALQMIELIFLFRLFIWLRDLKSIKYSHLINNPWYTSDSESNNSSFAYKREKYFKGN